MRKKTEKYQKKGKKVMHDNLEAGEKEQARKNDKKEIWINV